jgi:hypothetical protein
VTELTLMAGPDARKRSVVKHHTRAPHKKGGFSGGGVNAAAGSYIGRAKKVKADLIHKAKVKKAYYRMLEKEGISKGEPPVKQTDEGEEGAEDGAGEDAPASAPAPAAERPRKKKLPYFYVPPKKTEEAPMRTREEALGERQHKKELWHRKSPSRLGSKRGQPDLGARMEVMLDKIQKGRN